MTAGKTLSQTATIDNSPQVSLGDEALHAGLSLILADAARSHLRSGDIDKAMLCLQGAERCLNYLSTP